MLVSCITACGTCRFCREGRYGQCLGGGGWILGHTDRRHPGRVRPGALRRHLHLPRAPPASPTSRSSCSPTSSPPATRSACSTARCGPATSSPSSAPARSAWPPSWAPGCTARATSSPSTWPTARLEAAKQFGADIVVNNSREDAASPSSATSPAASAPTSPSKRSACPPPSNWPTRLVRPGGHVANIGVHGAPATLHLEDLWIRDVTITTGLVDTYSTPTLLAARHAAGSSTPPGSSPTTSPRRDRGGLRRVRRRRRHRRPQGRPHPDAMTNGSRTLGLGPLGPAARADRPSRTCPVRGHGGGNRLRPLETPCPPNPPSWPPPSPLRHAT